MALPTNILNVPYKVYASCFSWKINFFCLVLVFVPCKTHHYLSKSGSKMENSVLKSVLGRRRRGECNSVGKESSGRRLSYSSVGPRVVRAGLWLVGWGVATKARQQHTTPQGNKVCGGECQSLHWGHRALHHHHHHHHHCPEQLYFFSHAVVFRECLMERDRERNNQKSDNRQQFKIQEE